MSAATAFRVEAAASSAATATSHDITKARKASLDAADQGARTASECWEQSPQEDAGQPAVRRLGS
jgi:hypothetical protein